MEFKIDLFSKNSIDNNRINIKNNVKIIKIIKKKNNCLKHLVLNYYDIHSL